MYRKTKKSSIDLDPNARPPDCVAAETLYWFAALGILVAGGLVYAFSSREKPEPIYSSVANVTPVGGQLQTIALTQCPYCPGFLDAQGRCNMQGCPNFVPYRPMALAQQATTTGPIPVKKVLIRELALEVAPTEGKSSVIVQSVYIGGNAQKAGLKARDRIVRFNGRKIKNMAQFQSVVGRAAPEATVKIDVIRNGKKVKGTVMVGEGEMEGATPPPQPR